MARVVYDEWKSAWLNSTAPDFDAAAEDGKFFVGLINTTYTANKAHSQADIVGHVKSAALPAAGAGAGDRRIVNDTELYSGNVLVPACPDQGANDPCPVITFYNSSSVADPAHADSILIGFNSDVTHDCNGGDVTVGWPSEKVLDMDGAD